MVVIAILIISEVYAKESTVCQWGNEIIGFSSEYDPYDFDFDFDYYYS